MDDRRSSATLGCSLMLFSPILLAGALIRASTSRDMMTGVEMTWMYVLATTAAVMFLAGGMMWWKSR